MPSTRNFILLTLVVLLIFIQTSQTASVRYAMPDETQHYRSSVSSKLFQLWLDRLQQQIDEKESNDSNNDDVEHLWKRFAEFLPPNRERRRFGNTRYGRSLSTDLSN